MATSFLPASYNVTSVDENKNCFVARNTKNGKANSLKLTLTSHGHCQQHGCFRLYKDLLAVWFTDTRKGSLTLVLLGLHCM